MKKLIKKSEKAAWEHYDNGIYKAVSASRKKYKELLVQQKVYKLPQDFAISLMQDYAFSPMTKEEFCEYRAITKSLFERTMLSLIDSNCLNEDVFNRLYLKALKNNPKQEDEIDHCLTKLNNTFLPTIKLCFFVGYFLQKV